MSYLRRSKRLSCVPTLKSVPSHREDLIEISSTDDETENNNMNNSVNLPRKKKINKKVPKVPTKVAMETTLPVRRRETKRRLRTKSSSSELDDEYSPDLNDISPPKQIKSQNNIKSLLSPTRLLDRLSIDEYCQNDKTELKEFTISSYQNAKKVLNSSETNTLPGREKELKKLSDYLNFHLHNKMSGSLYISGQPGTGKTACLSKLLTSNEFSSKLMILYINCTSMSSIGSVYRKICFDLNIKINGRSSEKEYLTAVENFLANKNKMLLLVLDEIDQLCGKKQSVLYTIFEWPSKPEFNIILIGIANSLDLTDRLLTRLNINCELKPKLLNFPPYNKQQIVDIFKSRLEEAGVTDVFPPVTIQLLAAKVSALSGDVRRALDIGRRIVQIAEMEKHDNKKLNLQDLDIELFDNNDDENYNKNTPLQPIQVSQVVSVINNVYGNSQTLNNDIEHCFPLQQKILLCSLLLILKNSKNKDITVGRLHDVYKRVCLKKNILAVDQAEFVGLCFLVDSRGIIRVIGKKDPRLNKIVLYWDETEVCEALKDKQLIATILDDVSCLSY